MTNKRSIAYLWCMYKQERPASRGTPAWVRAFWIGALVILLAVAALHLTGHGFGHHGEMP